ncbi:hypothetical protein OAR04_02255 [Flavobacteriales bacterium]|nr:hypothetical protein [Flavobacteriales bacterium]
MKIIQNNPFRILGVISNASAKEINQAETYIIRYLEIGKSAELKFDISPPLKNINRTLKLINSAKNQIHTNFDKLNYSIFWFVNGSSIDKIALEKLSATKQIDIASETFKKGSKDFNVDEITFTSILNFSTSEILSYFNHKNKKRFTDSIKCKYNIISDKKIFRLFENIVTGDSGKVNQSLFLDKFMLNITELLREVFPRIDHNELLLDIFSDDDNILKDIEKNILSFLTEEINKKIEIFKSFVSKQSKKSDKQIISSKTNIINYSKDLIKNTKSELIKLKNLIGIDSFQYTNLVNEIYTSINAVTILCYNKEIKNNKVDINLYVKLLEEIVNELKNINCPIKETIIKNLKVIKEDESSTMCQFCNSGKIGNYTLKVEMHQMTGGYQYTYFKDGGLKISCCFSCIGKRIPLKLIAFLLAPLWWPVVFFITILIRQYKESWYSWLYRFIYKNLFGLSVQNHPIIKKHLNQGYKIGLP